MKTNASLRNQVSITYAHYAYDTIIRMFILAILSGIFIGIGASAALRLEQVFSAYSAIKLLLFAAIFPFGIILITFMGGNLYTSSLLVSLSFLDKKTSIKQTLSLIITAYIGNYIGTFLLALLTHSTELINNELITTILIQKTSLSTTAIFTRAVLCNAIVSSALWMATGAKTTIGKFIILWLCIFTFTIMQLEHSIANMFYFNMYLIDTIHSSLTIPMLKNIALVSFGNIFAPLLYSSIYSYIYPLKN